MQEEQAEALIVGGGAAGLAAAIELTDAGIEPVVLERRPGCSYRPRATMLTAAAMRLMWRWGVADEISRQGFAAEPAVSVRASLTAPELQRIPLGEYVWACPQDLLEEILAVRATVGGARIEYGAQLTGLCAGGDAVSAVATTADGVQAGLRASYVIGADGARSTVRRLAGITTTGERQRHDWLNITFRAPVRDYVSDPPFMVYRIASASGEEGFVVPADGADRWSSYLPWHPELGQQLADFDADRCAELVRSAAGVADLPVTVAAVDSLQRASVVADQARAGRVLLAGEAAHVYEPVSGPGLSLALEEGSAVAGVVAGALRGREHASGDEPGDLQPVLRLSRRELLTR